MPRSSLPVPMISALSLGPLPELLQHEMGNGVLRRVFHVSGLSSHLLHQRDGYIPEPALVRFFDGFAREAGREWVLGPWLYSIKFRDYGLWGAWVLSAPTLHTALQRASATIQLHGTMDTLTLYTRDQAAYFSYTFASPMRSGYGELAIGGAAALVSLCRDYLGPEWVPNAIRLNLAGLTGRDINALEVWFGCRIEMTQESIQIVFNRCLLNAPRQQMPNRNLTLHDVIRERAPVRPRTLREQVRLLVRRNLADGISGIDDVARALDIGVRRLQQRLQDGGPGFREILKSVTVERAQELLSEQNMTVTEIANEVGYEHVAHFSRMFRSEVGVTPSRYAKNIGNS